MDLRIGNARLAEEPVGELDDLGVDRGTRVADRLDVELPELAVAARLRTVVAEHGSGQGQLDWLRQRLHPVLDIGPHDARRRLRTECPRLAVPGPPRRPAPLPPGH